MNIADLESIKSKQAIKLDGGTRIIELSPTAIYNYSGTYEEYLRDINEQDSLHDIYLKIIVNELEKNMVEKR